MLDKPLVPDVKKARQLMGELEVDLLLASDWVNAGYLAGHFLDWDLPDVSLGNNWWGRTSKGLLSPYENFVGIPREKEKEPFFVYSIEDAGRCQYEQCWIKDLLGYGPGIDPIEIVAKSIRERSLEKGNIALVFDLPLRTFEDLKRVLPNASFRDGADILWKLRMVKSPEEIERLRKAAEATVRAGVTAFDAAREGMTELDMERIFRTALAQQGVYGACNHIVVGEAPFLIEEGRRKLPVDSRNRIVYSQPTERKLEMGDWIWLDIGGRYHYYNSDIGRHAKLGKLTQGEAEYYSKISTIYERVMGELRPGVKASHLYDVANKILKEAGLRVATDQAGHGIGLQIHEPPILVPNDNTVLESGMVLNLEMTFYEPNFNGMTNLEDTFIITDKGNEPLLPKHRPPPEIRELT